MTKLRNKFAQKITISKHNFLHGNDRKTSLPDKSVVFHLVSDTKNPEIDFTNPRIMS